VQGFARVWQKFDPEATGFIQLSELDALIVALADSEDARHLIVLEKDQISEAKRRERLIADL